MNSIVYIFILAFVAEIHGGIHPYEEYQQYALQQADYEKIATEDYNAVLFSTFPIESCMAPDVSHNDVSLLKTFYCIADIETLYNYCLQVSYSGNKVDTMCLGVRPDIITADDLLNLMYIWEDKHFEIIVSYPSLKYWKELDDEEYLTVMTAYTDFVNTLMSSYENNRRLQNHFSLYFYNSVEWLVGNYTNYESDFCINADIAHSLSTYTEQDPGYQLTLKNYKEALKDFEALVNDCRSETESAYPDLSEWDIVFFGDSVIAFPETSSIPGAFSGLTGAHTYNCGKGGSCAAAIVGYDEHSGIPMIVDAFLTENLSLFSEDSQILAGMTDYFEHADQSRQQCFVINLGLNDYLMGGSIKNDNPYDVYTYNGALRTAIEKLQNAYPDAVIILMTPNFTALFENGLQPQSDVGGQLSAYADAVVSICDEKGLLCYDSYNLLGIDADNYTEYLLDDTHPNESTRYTMAQGLAELIGSNIIHSHRFQLIH